MGSPFTAIRFQAQNASGILPFAELETYAAGTLTPLATYTSESLGTPNATTVICDASGQADVWVGSSAYRFRLYTSTASGRTLVYDRDNFKGPNAVTAEVLASLAASSGAGLIGWISDAASAVATTIQAWLRRGFVYPEDFGAVGDGTTLDYSSVQAALNTGKCEFKKGSVYNIGTTGVTVVTNGCIIKGNNAGLKYSGTGHGFDAALVSSAYPQNCKFSDFYVDCSASVSSGIRWRFSYSSCENLTSIVRASNSTAWRIETDFSGGTGPYYNAFHNCFATGKVGITMGVVNQTGWLFTTDASAPTRGPNTNTFHPGRTSDFTNGWVIAGAGNRIIGAAIEGTASGGQVFVFENTFGAGAGCINNVVITPYIEGQPGANCFKFGTNSNYNHIDRPYVTSLGGGTYLSDTSGSTTNTITDAYGTRLPNATSTDSRTLNWFSRGDASSSLAIAGSTTPGTQTYSIKTLKWQRVGNFCTFQLAIALSAKDGATAGNTKILGLPFTSGSTYATTCICDARVTHTAGYTWPGARIDPGQNYIYLVENGSGVAPQLLPVAAWSANLELFISGSYEVA